MSAWRDVMDKVLRKRKAYRDVFHNSKATDIVLSDLRSFCRGTSTPAVVSRITQTIDPMATGIAIGRQEVWHRIQQHLHISDADLYKYANDSESGTD